MKARLAPRHSNIRRSFYWRAELCDIRPGTARRALLIPALVGIFVYEWELVGGHGVGLVARSFTGR